MSKRLTLLRTHADKAIATFVVLTIVFTGTIVIDEVAGEYDEERAEKAALGNATYGEGNWTWETVGCWDLCVESPRPVNDTVPNASVKVPPTEDDICQSYFCGWGGADFAITLLLAVGIFLLVGLYGRYQRD